LPHKSFEVLFFFLFLTFRLLLEAPPRQSLFFRMGCFLYTFSKCCGVGAPPLPFLFVSSSLILYLSSPFCCFPHLLATPQIVVFFLPPPGPRLFPFGTLDLFFPSTAVGEPDNLPPWSRLSALADTLFYFVACPP